MASVNVLDFNTFVRSYMIYSIKKYIPDLDTSDNSAFDDLFVKPMLQILPPVSDTVTSLEFKMNLDNAPNMTVEDLDEIGNGNYLIPRLAGSKATAAVTLSYLKVDPNNNLIIPAGTTFTTDSGLQYQVSQKYEFTPTELMTKYNVSRTTYDVVVPAEAIEVGTAYNVSENQIKNTTTKLGITLASITNKVPVTDGVDSETNIDYAQRLREYYVSRQLGTKPGYKQFIFSNFSEVNDIYIAGFGDDEMMRDIVTVVRNGIPQTMHIGGKVDFYIKGSIFSSTSTTLTLNTGKLKLSQPYSLISAGSITIDNLGDNLKTPVGAYTVGSSNDAYITLDNTGNQSYDPALVNQIKVTYTYTGGLAPMEEIFQVGLTQTNLDSPFKSIILVYESNNDSVTYDITKYQILRYDLYGNPITLPTDTYYGTSQESVKFHWTDMDLVINGTPITISYTTNKTLNDLKVAFNVSENRIITTDLLFKEATPLFINIAFGVKLRSGQTLDDVKIASINNSIANYFSILAMGSKVDESDIIGNLYKDASVNTFLEYIMLPFDSFYVATDPAAPITPQRDGTFIKSTNLQYPSLNKVSITAIP